MENRLEMLQLLYAGLLAEAVSLFEQHGILDNITEQKLREEILSASARIKQLQLQTPEDIFSLHSSVIGFTDWNIEPMQNGFRITNSHCKLYAITKALDCANPCLLCCIHPLNALCEALNPKQTIIVETTMKDSNRCTFFVQPKIK